MKIKYHHAFDLPKTIVWKYIKDADVLRKAFQGCKRFEEPSEGIYQAEIAVNWGPIKDVFILDIRTIEEQDPSTYRLLMKGKGNLGEIHGKGMIVMKGSQGTSKLSFLAEGEATEALGFAVQRFLNAGAEKMLGSFFGKIEKEIKHKLYQLKRGR